MKYKKIGLILLGILIPTITIPSLASSYEDFPLTPGQIKFINLIDSYAGTKFSKLIDTPNANRIISAGTFACGHKDFQKNFIIAAGVDKSMVEQASKTFESLLCSHLDTKDY